MDVILAGKEVALYDLLCERLDRAGGPLLCAGLQMLQLWSRCPAGTKLMSDSGPDTEPHVFDDLELSVDLAVCELGLETEYAETYQFELSFDPSVDAVIEKCLQVFGWTPHEVIRWALVAHVVYLRAQREGQRFGVLAPSGDRWTFEPPEPLMEHERVVFTRPPVTVTFEGRNALLVRAMADLLGCSPAGVLDRAIEVLRLWEELPGPSWIGVARDGTGVPVSTQEIALETAYWRIGALTPERVNTPVLQVHLPPETAEFIVAAGETLGFEGVENTYLGVLAIMSKGVEFEQSGGVLLFYSGPQHYHQLQFLETE